jgi:hypothetical protein
LTKQIRKSEARKKIIERSHADPFFLGWAFKKYELSNSWNDQQLADWLQCSLDTLSTLALCRRPQDDKADFQKELQKIATFGACNVDRLIQLLRGVASLSTLQDPSTDPGSGFLMAARDRIRSRKDR